MFRILYGTKIDFMRHWKRAAIGTTTFIVLGMIALGVRGLNESIEFTGGTLVQLHFSEPPGIDVVRAAAADAGFPRAEITQFGPPTEFTVKTAALEGEAAANPDSTAALMAGAIGQRLPGTAVEVVRSEAVGPRVGRELRRNATIAILISFAVVLVYLAIRFDWRFGLAAVLATAHDLISTIAFLAMMRLEVSLTVVAALLTVVGYSLNNTIVIFDRVRENLRKQRKESLREVLNRSINETLPRSVLTHTTTFAATLTLLLFAGEVIRPFSWIMAFGITTGTFASLFLAGPLLLWIEHRWPPAANTERKGAARALAEERRRERSGATAATR